MYHVKAESNPLNEVPQNVDFFKVSPQTKRAR